MNTLLSDLTSNTFRTKDGIERTFLIVLPEVMSGPLTFVSFVVMLRSIDGGCLLFW